MPVDDIIPSREKEGYMNRMAATMQLEAKQAEQAAGGKPAEMQPDGTPKGGQDANTVSNRDTGAAG